MTGYKVHYRDENTGIEKSTATASATISEITDLISDHTYTFIVEATSEHLSGLSDIVTAPVGKIKETNLEHQGFGHYYPECNIVC